MASKFCLGYGRFLCSACFLFPSVGLRSCKVVCCLNQNGAPAKSSSEELEVEERSRQTLQELDKQLQSLSHTDSNISRTSKPAIPSSPLPPQESVDAPLQWPEFTDGFLAYAAGFLLLLTVVNNVLYRVFFGPSVNPLRKLVVEVPSERAGSESSKEAPSLTN